MLPLTWQVIGFVWIFNLVCWAIQEVAKLITYKCFEYYYSFVASDTYVAPRFHTDSFLGYSATFKLEGYRSIVTRRSIISAQESQRV